ncbi:unnamed protein product [Ambrosiozyma monospora]|uniref:Unnamed protein product n=1 Tax=Ambrosiozyma monospora TaxID=43982 RepID=A0A9W7DHC5_AMBMO|nr:unnamed protein product [Ambrosiozyma monospora]
MFAVIDLKGRMTPKKCQSVVHNEDENEISLEFQSKLKHCYYRGSTNHARSYDISAIPCAPIMAINPLIY